MQGMDEALLMAYVDGELDPAGVVEVEHAIAADPALERRVGLLRDANAVLRAAFNPTLNEPVPERLLAPLGAQARKPWRPGALRRYTAMAAMLAIVMLGGVGFYANTNYELPYNIVATSQGNWLNSIANYHQVYLLTASRDERLLVDVGGEDLGYLEDWFSKRLKRHVSLPNLEPQGFQIQGGRLMFVEGQQAAQFFYRAAGGDDVVSLTIAQTKRRDTEWTATKRAGLRIIYWRKNGYAYVITGAVDKQVLHGVAAGLTDEQEKI